MKECLNCGDNFTPHDDEDYCTISCEDWSRQGDEDDMGDAYFINEEGEMDE